MGSESKLLQLEPEMLLTSDNMLVMRVEETAALLYPHHCFEGEIEYCVPCSLASPDCVCFFLWLSESLFNIFIVLYWLSTAYL